MVISGLVVHSHGDVLVHDVNLDPQSKIVGAVELEPGGPPEKTIGITARLSDDPGGLGFFYNTIEDSLFGFEIGNLPAGIYEVKVSREGYQTLNLNGIAVGTGELRT